MIQWAHGELTVDDDGPVTWNCIGDPLPLKVEVGPNENEYNVIATLGLDGWEMVQFHRYSGSTVYWFKKRITLED